MSTRIISDFNADSTAEEVANGIDLSGKQVIITGAASGIGTETARVMLLHGAKVTLAVRDIEKGQVVARKLSAETKNKNVYVTELDLNDPNSIVDFVESWKEPLDILINNAGVMNVPTLKLSPSGYEMQFSTNYLGHFALAYGLHNALARVHGRIVSVSSSAHLHSDIDWNDINFKFREYQPEIAYAQSKTAVNLFTVGVSHFWKKDGVTANALMPGGIMTNLQRYVPKTVLEKMGATEKEGTLINTSNGWKTISQGAATTIFVATSPLLNGVSGRYFENSNEVIANTENAGSYGVAEYSLNMQNAIRLWRRFEPIVKKWYQRSDSGRKKV